MPAHYFFAIGFFVLAQLCIHWNNQLTLRILKAVNAHRPPDQQIPAAVLTRKVRRIVEAEYRFHYPESRLLAWSTVLLILGFLAFLLTAIAFFK